ncbi:adhesin transport system membrane fusion protein [Actimicrobium sp. GrIS 1.19]|uniref:HlyD family type I secretion periplasmic adaptor subunit n=1 Tax=Actimicrobium sp. GrIS 1.19 TaxID=3071708 RepID=UPI002E09B904|nr:adhesin transport system membrane fusion protein [Actimicrobium sp. GrIS 1.19]
MLQKFKAMLVRLGARLQKLLLPAATDDAERRADLEFMSDSSAALVAGTPRFGSLIIRGLVLFIVLAIVWATFAPIDEITIGEGKVIPSGQVQVIQNLEGGIVAQIPVQVGDLVQKDQIVLYLDKTRFSSSVDEVTAKYQALQARIARLTVETDGRPFAAPAELVKANPNVVEEEKQLHLNRQRELDAALTVLREQANQRGQELREKRARLTQLEESQRLVTKELTISKPLVAQGVLSEVEVLRLERQVSDLRGETEATRLAIPRIDQSLSEARAKVDGQLAKFRSDAATELNLARSEFEQSRASGVAMADRLARTAVRSPVAGIVKQMKIATVGGVIQPGMDVMEIVPIENNLLIEARVRPADVAFIHPGQPATVKLSAYDFSIYGGLDAKVDNITADSITNDKGESFYLVRVRTLRNNLGAGDKNLPIIPGMMATIHIRTGKKTVLNYLLKPVIKAKQEALRER